MTTTEFAGRGRRVVIVEDNHAAADSMQQLHLFRHDVRVAYNGPDGVQMAEDWPPDFVLCDIGPPGLDGYGGEQGSANTLRHRESIRGRLAYGLTTATPWPGSRVERHFTKPVDRRDS